MRADADWKHAPQKSSGHKVSPLVLELWKALDKDGVLTAAEARETLGRELTEAAVLRGLCELWQALRISPVFADAGQPARWELLRVRHREALATAARHFQVTALSLLVSMYLQSVYAASSEEIEIFLSPVASRSRVREAVRGLAATRQIHSLSMDAQTYYFLENGLPEFAGLVAPRDGEYGGSGNSCRGGGHARLETPAGGRLAGPEADRAARPMRPASPASRPAKPAAFAPRRGAAPRPGAAPPRQEPSGQGRVELQASPPRPAPYRPERDAGKRHSGPPGRRFPPRTNGEPRAGRQEATSRRRAAGHATGQANVWPGVEQRKRNGQLRGRGLPDQVVDLVRPRPAAWTAAVRLSVKDKSLGPRQSDREVAREVDREPYQEGNGQGVQLQGALRVASRRRISAACRR